MHEDHGSFKGRFRRVLQRVRDTAVDDMAKIWGYKPKLISAPQPVPPQPTPGDSPSDKLSATASG
jgi:hypothetical protein